MRSFLGNEISIKSAFEFYWPLDLIKDSLAEEIILEVFKNSAAIFLSLKILTGKILYGQNFMHKAAGFTYYCGLKTRSDDFFYIFSAFLIKTSQLLKYPPYNKFCIGCQRSFIDKKCVTSLDLLSIHAKQNVHCIR